MKLLVREIPLDGSEHRRKWAVDIDCGEEFNYRGRVSSNAFFHSTKKRNYTGDVLYFSESPREARRADLNEYEEVESIWKFYEIIGYDYKTKKYSTELPVTT